jgi:hypothetical protein
LYNEDSRKMFNNDTIYGTINLSEVAYNG